MNLLSLIFVFVNLIIINAKNDGFGSTLGHITPKTDEATQQTAANGLIRRILPEETAKLFSVIVNSKLGLNGRDTFKIHKLSTGIVQITASSGATAAWGFNHYLKYFCKLHVAWQAEQLNLKTPLPDVNITITSNDRFRYYQNVCTTSYSYVWWDTAAWEKHIDWTAMNGFNLVLAFNGQEAIWARVYKQLNLTATEIGQHFGGPAFLAWARMGNLRGWGGPLTDYWHDRSIMLQHFILRRMRDLGITPILPAFSGHVPKAFRHIFPNAKMTSVGSWMSFPEKYCCPYLVDPYDPLFQKIGSMFLVEQTKEFGSDHVYSCDTFNEMVPGTNNPEYIAGISRSIYSAMTYVDPKAVWVLQAWLFRNAPNFWTKELARSFLTAVPLGHMVVLDLQSEAYPQYTRYDSFFGQPFIWCMLHNSGGTLGLYGSAEIVNTQVFVGRRFPNSTLIGTGLTPEGINQNYVIYDLMTEMGWRTESVNLDEWFANYTIRRYGKKDDGVIEAWQILKKTVYSLAGDDTRKSNVVSVSPNLEINPQLPYAASEFMKAWGHLVNSSDNFLGSPGFLHDLVDVTRQALQDLIDLSYIDLKEAFHLRQIGRFQKLKEQFLELFSDLESILATNKAFLLGAWLEAAKRGAPVYEQHIYEQNARNQITLWGPNGQIKDYAIKQWSGLVSHYMIPRWELFLNAMNSSLVSGLPFDEHLIRDRIYNEIESAFTFKTNVFPVTATGNTIQLAKYIYRKWMNKTPQFFIEEYEDINLYNKLAKWNEEPQIITM